MMICAESLQLQMRRSTLDRSLHQRVFHGCVPAAVSPRTHQRASTPSLEVLARAPLSGWEGQAFTDGCKA